MFKYDIKGQISLFIVIGVILILGAIFLISFTSNEVPLFSDDQSSSTIRNHVQACIEIEANQAIQLIANHGGWLYKPIASEVFIDRDTPSFLVEMARGYKDPGDAEIPYWVYIEDNEIKTNIPNYDKENDKYSLKNQLKRYLDENLEENCIREFRDFEDAYDIDYDPKDINHKVTFTNEEILISLDLPIEIYQVNADQREYLESFNTQIENRIKEPYYLAKDIAHAQKENAFIERNIISFMSAYQSTSDTDLLPPFYEIEIGKFNMAVWSIPKIEDLLQNIISNHIGTTHFTETANRDPNVPDQVKDHEFVKGLYGIYQKSYFENISQVKENDPRLFESFQNYFVNTVYDKYLMPMHFELNPSHGNIIYMAEPEMFLLDFFPLGYTEYETNYDITAPILFEIRRDQAVKDLKFNLAVEANIKNNVPQKDIIEAEFEMPEEFLQAQEESQETSSSNTLICSPWQRTSAPVTFNITDPINHGERTSPDDPVVGVEGAHIEFSCKGLTTCYIDSTQINGESHYNNVSQVNVTLPPNCDPGTLTVSKYGYKGIEIEDLNPSQNTPIDLGEFEMPSAKEIDVEIQLHKNFGVAEGDGRRLDRTDSGFIIFEHKEEEDYVQVIQADYENQNNLSVELIPGNYSIEGYVFFEKDDHVLPETTIEGEKVEEVDLPAWLRGGIETGREITTDELIHRNSVTIRIYEIGVPYTLHELIDMAEDLDKIDEMSVSPTFE